MLSLSIFLSILALVSIIVVIIGRKLTYLRKLPLTDGLGGETGERIGFWGFLSEFFPELLGPIKEFNWHRYQSSFLKELEKLLRRLRVASLKLESWASSLINKLRSNGHYSSGSVGATKQATGLTSVKPLVSLELEESDPTSDYHKKEQALIISIAKDPKNPELYRQLADVYYRLNNLPDALEAWRTVLKLDPKDERTRAKLEKIEKTNLLL